MTKYEVVLNKIYRDGLNSDRWTKSSDTLSNIHMLIFIYMTLEKQSRKENSQGTGNERIAL